MIHSPNPNRQGRSFPLVPCLLGLLALSLIAVMTLPRGAEPPGAKPPVAKKSAESFLMVRNGRPVATLVVDRQASDQVKTAARTLQSYVAKSTGALLPISDQPGAEASLHIGMTTYVKQLDLDLKTLDEEGFLLRAPDENNFVIVGGGDWGTEFGVYDFLERYLGVRWLMPGDAGEVVPKHASLEIPALPVREEPVYNLARTLSGVRSATGDEIDWSRFNRVRFDRLARQHNLNRLFPVSQFGRSHPEFYPILDKARFLPHDDASYQWQPNFSAPGIVEAAAQQIDRYFDANPGMASYSLAPNDTANFDESPASLERRTGKRNRLNFQDVSNDYFPWANAVVAEVLASHPDKWFGTQAYRETLEPPTNVAQLNARLVPHITFERLQWSDPRLRAADQALTERWAKIAPNLGWYDYVYGLSYLTPRVWPHLMQEYLSWGASHHVRSFHGDYLPNWPGEGPKTWLLAKLLWNPNRDVDALLADWYENAVGPAAAPKLRDYYAIWETFWAGESRQSDWSGGEGDDGRLYLPFQDPGYLLDVPLASVNRADALMAETVNLADTPPRKARALRMAKMWRFYKDSILAFQEESAAASAHLQSEGEVLALLEKFEGVMAQSRERLQLLQGFGNDDGPFHPYFFSRPLLVGVNWGNSLLWRALPWLKQSAAVRKRVEAVAASGAPEAKESARILLAAADGRVAPLLRNPSFENGLEGWTPRVHRMSGGELKVSKDTAKTGTQSLLAAGTQRALTSQSIPYQAGDYYVTVSCRVPEGQTKGKAQLRFWVGGKSWRDKGYEKFALALPAQNIALDPGAWRTLAMPFRLPADREAATLFVSIDTTEFPPDGKVYIDDLEIFRVAK